MASSWIKVEVITPDKPEVFQIAEILDIDPDAALGKLIRLWVWADQQTIDGNANSNADSVTKLENGNAIVITKSAIDRVTFVKGFADALISAGWLIVERNTLVFKDLDKHNGESSKKRALGSNRSARSRERKRNSNANSNADGVTVACQKASVEEEIEEDINTIPNGIGTSDDSDDPKRESDKKSERINYQAIIDAYHDILPKMPAIVVMTDKRKRDIRSLWKKFDFNQSKWEAYLDYISQNCQWMTEDRPNGKGGYWKAKNLDYLITERCYVSVKERRANDK